MIMSVMDVREVIHGLTLRPMLGSHQFLLPSFCWIGRAIGLRALQQSLTKYVAGSHPDFSSNCLEQARIGAHLLTSLFHALWRRSH
jgi:hypothetical protein